MHLLPIPGYLALIPPILLPTFSGVNKNHITKAPCQQSISCLPQEVGFTELLEAQANGPACMPLCHRLLGSKTPLFASSFWKPVRGEGRTWIITWTELSKSPLKCLLASSWSTEKEASCSAHCQNVLSQCYSGAKIHFPPQSNYADLNRTCFF